MKALIFAAGLGTRLQPITSTLPKALVEVAGKTALQHAIERVAQAGITDIVINVHHFAPQIVDHLNLNNNFGLNISVSDESDLLLDTGGGLLKALPSLEPADGVVLYNADILSDIPIGEMVDCHRESGADATLLVSNRSTSRYLLFDTKGRMQGWKNVKTGEIRPDNLEISQLSAMAFGGIHIINASSLRPLLEQYAQSNGKVFSITPFYIENCARLNIQSFIPSQSYQWFDIGSIEKLQKARSEFHSTT